MKSLFQITLAFVFIIGITCGQVFINYGTGVRDIPYQKQMGDLKSGGCLFMSICVIGGLGSKQELLDARSWALSTKYIRSDNYLLTKDRMGLAYKISKKYGTTYHSDFSISSNGHHFWVVDSSGKQVFNSAGLDK